MSELNTPRSPLSTVSAIAGVMFITAGAVAVTTGEFDEAGVWIVIVGLAAAGVAGLLRSLTALVADS